MFLCCRGKKKENDEVKDTDEFREERKLQQRPGKKVRWLTRSMAEEFSRMDVLVTTFKEALLYLLFVIAVTVSTIGARNPSMFYLTQALRGQFLETGFVTLNDVEIKFSEIRSATDFWHYAESLMLDSFYWEYYYDPNDPVKPLKSDERKILYENKLLGVPRMRMLKVKNDSCVIHEYFRRIFLNCYDAYTPYSKDVDKSSFGKGSGTAWRWNGEEKTKSISFTGKVGTYDGSGFYQDLKSTRNASAKVIKELKQNLWITRGTRAIFVDFAVYNANLNLFCLCKLSFEFPPTGGIIPKDQLRAVRLIKFHETRDYVIFGFECLFYVLAFFYLCEEIREVCYFKLRYLLQFWTYIDLILIAMACGCVIMFIRVKTSVDDAIAKISRNMNKYGNLEELGEMKFLLDNFRAAALFFTYIKIFKYLNFNKTMGQLNNTLKRCALDILGFSIMFFIIFFAYAELGYLLFGSQVEDFSSFGIAMFTLLRTILGDFDYQAIEHANRILAPIYFLSYIFFVFFVLLNMFLAIINDTYADVKTEIAIAPDEMQMTDFLKTGFYRLLRKCGCKVDEFSKKKSEYNATVQQIRDALKKCGFSDLEIEMFFARYNIDPMAEVHNYDIQNLMKELEGGPGKEGGDEGSIVQINDFIAQQERLEHIERTILSLGNKVDTLIKKLDALDNVRKGKAPQG